MKGWKCELGLNAAEYGTKQEKRLVAACSQRCGPALFLSMDRCSGLSGLGGVSYGPQRREHGAAGPTSNDSSSLFSMGRNGVTSPNRQQTQAAHAMGMQTSRSWAGVRESG